VESNALIKRATPIEGRLLVEDLYFFPENEDNLYHLSNNHCSGREREIDREKKLL
jgi:hypothetical protein